MSGMPAPGRSRNGSFDELIGIQYGTRPDPFGWIHEVAPSGMGGASAASG